MSDDGDATDAPAEDATDRQDDASAGGREGAGPATAEEGDGSVAGDDGASDSESEAASDQPTARLLPKDELVEAVAAHDESMAEDVGALYRAAQDLGDRVDELEAELAAAEEEVDDLRSQLKRKQADFQNYKKRRKRKEEEIRERATEDLVERLLDVRDDLQRALEGDYDDVEGIREGVKMTVKEFDRVLDAEDVHRIDPDPGSDVDPGRHEVMTRVDSDQPEGTVADVYEPGYEMADSVLRAAKVTVSEGGDDESGGS